VYEQRQRPELLPSNPLAKALAYVSERQSQLKVFLSNPDVPIDINHLERSLRVIPTGRKIIYSVGVSWAPSSLAYCKV
jgi:transposase